MEIVISKNATMMAPARHPAGNSWQVPQRRQRQLAGRGEMLPADVVEQRVVPGDPGAKLTDHGERRGPLGLADQPCPDSVLELVFVEDARFPLA